MQRQKIRKLEMLMSHRHILYKLHFRANTKQVIHNFIECDKYTSKIPSVSKANIGVADWRIRTGKYIRIMKNCEIFRTSVVTNTTNTHDGTPHQIIQMTLCSLQLVGKITSIHFFLTFWSLTLCWINVYYKVVIHHMSISLTTGCSIYLQRNISCTIIRYN